MALSTDRANNYKAKLYKIYHYKVCMSYTVNLVLTSNLAISMKIDFYK